MTATHTPGPWAHIGTRNAAGVEIPGEVVSALAGATVCVCPHARAANADRITADARLIAAAPDLLAALRDCAFALESVAHLRRLERELLPFADHARAVIAKAEGNS